MAQLWKSSRWLRHYDWDWATAPWPEIEHEIAEYRSRILPRRFLYHVLNVARRQADIDAGARPTDLALQFLEYQPQLAEIVDVFREPREVGDILRPPYRDILGGANVALTMFRHLRGLGWIIPAEEVEPAKEKGIFLASHLLYGIFQTETEMIEAMKVVREYEPRTMMEIGTARGGSLFCWAQLAHPDAFLISLDLPGGRWGGGYAVEQIQHFRQFLYPTQTLASFLGDSQNPETVAQIGQTLDGRKLDVLYIDGDHTYQGAKLDFVNYKPFVRPGGLVLLHDINPPAPGEDDRGVQVYRLWEELKGEYECEEIWHPDRPIFGVVRL